MTTNVEPWLLAIPGVTFTEREQHEHESGTPRRRCVRCKERKTLAEFAGSGRARLHRVPGFACAEEIQRDGQEDMTWPYWILFLAVEGFVMLLLWALCRAGRDQ